MYVYTDTRTYMNFLVRVTAYHFKLLWNPEMETPESWPCCQSCRNDGCGCPSCGVGQGSCGSQRSKEYTAKEPIVYTNVHINVYIYIYTYIYIYMYMLHMCIRTCIHMCAWHPKMGAAVALKASQASGASLTKIRYGYSVVTPVFYDHKVE